MKIEIVLNGNKYAIVVESNSYVAIKYGINQSEGKNFGKETTKELGWFTKLSTAALRLCREEIANSDDVVGLQEFARRIEAINAQLREQLEAAGV